MESIPMGSSLYYGFILFGDLWGYTILIHMVQLCSECVGLVYLEKKKSLRDYEWGILGWAILELVCQVM